MWQNGNPALEQQVTVYLDLKAEKEALHGAITVTDRSGTPIYSFCNISSRIDPELATIRSRTTHIPVGYLFASADLKKMCIFPSDTSPWGLSDAMVITVGSVDRAGAVKILSDFVSRCSWLHEEII